MIYSLPLVATESFAWSSVEGNSGLFLYFFVQSYCLFTFYNFCYSFKSQAIDQPTCYSTVVPCTDARYASYSPNKI